MQSSQPTKRTQRKLHIETETKQTEMCHMQKISKDKNHATGYLPVTTHQSPSEKIKEIFMLYIGRRKHNRVKMRRCMNCSCQLEMCRSGWFVNYVQILFFFTFQTCFFDVILRSRTAEEYCVLRDGRQINLKACRHTTRLIMTRCNSTVITRGILVCAFDCPLPSPPPLPRLSE